MAWTSPKTWVANSKLTAAELNTHLRDNMLQTAAAAAANAGGYFIATGANSLVQRRVGVDQVTTSDVTTSTTFTDLDTTVGPEVTVTTGAQAMVFYAARCVVDTAGREARVSYEVTGATSVTASLVHAIRMENSDASDSYRLCMADMVSLTPGVNTFTLKYAVTGGEGNFAHRILFVVPL